VSHLWILTKKIIIIFYRSRKKKTNIVDGGIINIIEASTNPLEVNNEYDEPLNLSASAVENQNESFPENNHKETSTATNSTGDIEIAQYVCETILNDSPVNNSSSKNEDDDLVTYSSDLNGQAGTESMVHQLDGDVSGVVDLTNKPNKPYLK
jgi:hypothetical protein